MKQKLLIVRSLFRTSNKGNKVDKNSNLYDLFVRKIPAELSSIFESFNLKIKGSLGQGNMTTHPWISFLNPEITTTTQEGLYVVLLFDSAFENIYISLNQGITYFEKHYKRKKYEYAIRVSKYFQEEMKSDQYLSFEPIDLLSQKGTLGYGYEQTNIASIKYNIKDINEEEFFMSLRLMLNTYDDIFKHMLPDRSYEQLVESILFDSNSAFSPVDESIKEIKQVIQKEMIETSGVQRKISLVKTGKISIQKFKRLSAPIIRKTDYVDKAKRDAVVGLYGEKMVLEFEKERLTNLGRPDLAEKILHISAKVDSFGYDIKSFSIDQSKKIIPLFIEVKTSSTPRDNPFPVSSNEVKRSQELKDNYAVYRIFDCYNVNPKLYIAKGSIDDNFYLDPITYNAKYKYELEIY